MTQMQSKIYADLRTIFVQNLHEQRFIHDVLTLLADACNARANWLISFDSSDKFQINKLQKIAQALYWTRNHNGLGDDLEDAARIIHEEET